MSDAKRRIVDRLKRVESATVPELAAGFDLTDTAVRQHLETLEENGLVERAPSPPPVGRGRPPVRWQLSAIAAELFPDRHADLTVELIGSIRAALGEEGLERVLEARGQAQLSAYRKALPDPAVSSVPVRVSRLAEVRSAEGYLAEVKSQEDGSLVLVEHHCPVCDAASACQGLCRTELDLFQAALGDDVTVERVQHLLSGDQRCAYRITASSSPASAGASAGS
jgi:predicted ArsR family transcriptional regulator